jgi:large conductance mechanosensitive channel
MWKEFKKFAIKGNIVDLAIGVIIGGAFNNIVSSFVNDIVMPLFSLITGRIDFTNLFISLDGVKYATLEQAKAAGAPTLNCGVFLSAVINFFIVAFSIFIFVKQINKFKQKFLHTTSEPTTKNCPYCLSVIPIQATRCPHCTSYIKDENHSEN